MDLAASALLLAPTIDASQSGTDTLTAASVGHLEEGVMEVIHPNSVAVCVLRGNAESGRFWADRSSAATQATSDTSRRSVHKAFQVHSQSHVDVEHKLIIVVATPEELIGEVWVVGVVLELLFEASVDRAVVEQNAIELIV